MGKKLSLSLLVAIFTTFFSFVIKLFNFSKWSELMIPFYIGIAWFFFVLIVLNILEKQFSNEMAQLGFNLFNNKTKNFEKKTNLGEKQANSFDDINDRVDFKKSKAKLNEATFFSTKGNKAYEQDLFQAKKNENKAPQKGKKAGELTPEDFDFKTEKIANAVRTVLNKE